MLLNLALSPALITVVAVTLPVNWRQGSLGQLSPDMSLGSSPDGQRLVDARSEGSSLQKVTRIPGCLRPHLGLPWGCSVVSSGMVGITSQKSSKGGVFKKPGRLQIDHKYQGSD